MATAKEAAKPSPATDSQFPVPNVCLGGEGMVGLGEGPSVPGWAERGPQAGHPLSSGPQQLEVLLRPPAVTSTPVPKAEPAIIPATRNEPIGLKASDFLPVSGGPAPGQGGSLRVKDRTSPLAPGHSSYAGREDPPAGGAGRRGRHVTDPQRPRHHVCGTYQPPQEPGHRAGCVDHG